MPAHSSAVAMSALDGCKTDSSLSLAGGNRSGMVRLVLCGCATIGFVEISPVGSSDLRKATILLIWAKAGISLFLGREELPYSCIPASAATDIWGNLWAATRRT